MLSEIRQPATCLDSNFRGDLEIPYIETVVNCVVTTFHKAELPYLSDTFPSVLHARTLIRSGWYYYQCERDILFAFTQVPSRADAWRQCQRCGN